MFSNSCHVGIVGSTIEVQTGVAVERIGGLHRFNIADALVGQING